MQPIKLLQFVFEKRLDLDANIHFWGLEKC